MKNSDDTIGNRTRELPDCSGVPQSTAPPRAPFCRKSFIKYLLGRLSSLSGDKIKMNCGKMSFNGVNEIIGDGF
jgi:hypothetical protein